MEVTVSNLSYTFSPKQPLSLDHVTLDLPKGSRTLLVGANGAGKFRGVMEIDEEYLNAN